MEEEHGGVGDVRFSDDVRMVDSAGNEVRCQCGKPAGSTVIGKGSFVGWCTDCCPMPKGSVTFVYREPTE